MQGCARAFGYCASSHLDSVIERLGEIGKTDLVRKSTGFLGMSKDKTEADVARIKATMMLSYGYVALYSPPELITSRIEACSRRWQRNSLSCGRSTFWPRSTRSSQTSRRPL